MPATPVAAPSTPHVQPAAGPVAPTTPVAVASQRAPPVLTSQQCCERSQFEHIPTHLRDMLTSRELARMTGTRSFLLCPPMLRVRASHRDCVHDAAWAAQLQYDYVVHNAPSLEHCGCFPEYRWITMPPYRELRLGTPNLPIPRNYSARSHPGFGRAVACSRDVSVALRH